MKNSEEQFDLIVIGSGPGGYVAAIRAAQLGMKVAVVEKEKTLGGTCLNIGCIPSKALLESSEQYVHAQNKLQEHGIKISNVSLDFKKMMERKEKIVQQLTGGVAFLFKKNKITSIPGIAKLEKGNSVSIQTTEENKKISAKNILIATGSYPVKIPSLKIDQENILDSTGALSLQTVPQKLVVVGGGYIGLELGSVYLRLGSQVVVVEAMDQIASGLDRELGQALHRSLKKQGMEFQLSTKVQSVHVANKKKIQLTIENQGKEDSIEAEKVLVAVGRKPYTEGLGLEGVGIKVDEKGFILVNPEFQTSQEGIYAIGDVIPGPMLAHKASAEGVAAVEIMAGQAGQVNHGAIPSVVYTWPEVASVGLTEEQLQVERVEYKKSKFPFTANGRALSLGETEGWVKVLADSKTDRLLGAHMIGPRVSELIGEMVLAREFSASAEDIARTVHAHPTLSETLKEAALGVEDGSIHS